MRKDWTPAPKANETKQRIPVWLYPSTLEVVDKLVKQDNCKSRSDYLETAAQFYAGYLSGEEATAYLPPALVAAMRGTVQDSENRIARLLFKLAVEINMMMNVLAAGMEISDGICASSAPALSVKSSRPTAASISRMRLITSEARNKAK